jgi:SAM-dependent methyltransferase
MRWNRSRHPQIPVPESPSLGILDEYVRSSPSDQNALDLFSGEWSSQFPVERDLLAGNVPLFEDPRISWTIEQMGGVQNRRVLELGPLEGGHTAMLDAAGASVLAIESNSRAYLKCLITKEVLGFANSKFLLGDFAPFLAETPQRFDLVVASGVLYHSPDPLALIKSIARVSDRVSLWTHYFDEEVVAARPDLLRVFVDDPETVEWEGTQRTLHRRRYLESLEWGGFCGGPEASAIWLERDELLDSLHRCGFNDIKIQSDDRENKNGACIMLIASK